MKREFSNQPQYNVVVSDLTFVRVGMNGHYICVIVDLFKGKEFKNRLLDGTLKTFQIKRSLSMKGCPYDNAVAEATFKLIKTELLLRTFVIR